TSAPLLTRWFSSTDHKSASDPYFLYGASNLGSMIALLGYPVIIEPLFTLMGQQVTWVIGYLLLAGLTAYCALLMWRSNPAATTVVEGAGAPVGDMLAGTVAEAGSDPLTAQPPKGKKSERITTTPPEGGPDLAGAEPRGREGEVTWARRLRWLALAMVPSSLMLGATTYISTDIAAIPLLWVLPLALYLLTFII